MGRWILTEADRDTDGKILVDRSLADLLPPLPVAPDSGDEPDERPQLSRRQLVGSGAVVVLLALALFALSQQAAPATSVIVRPAAPVPTVARPTASISTPTIAPAAPMVVAFAEPDGAVLGPILLPTAAVARFGSDWVEVTWQGGRVWVRLSDAPGLEIARLPDLQPPTSAPVVVIPPAAAPPAAVQGAPAIAPTAHSSNHARPDDSPGPPTSVPAFTVR
jgi:hypothetical protein